MSGSSSGSRTPPSVTPAICRIKRALACGLASSKSCRKTVNRADTSFRSGPDRTTSRQSPGSAQPVIVPVKDSPCRESLIGRLSPLGAITTAERESPSTRVPSGRVMPVSNASGLPTASRRLANLSQSVSPSASSRRASQSTSCRQNRRWASSFPCITHRQVESAAKVSTRPSPYSRATNSGCPAAVTANGLASGSKRLMRLAPSRGGNPCQTASESAAVSAWRRIETPPKRRSGSNCSGPRRCRSCRIGSPKR